MIDILKQRKEIDTMLKIKKIKPMFNRIVVTATRYEKDVRVGSIIDGIKSDTIKEYQKVIEVGPTVRDVKVGDMVLINPSRYAIRQHQEGTMKDGVITDNPVTKYNFKMITLNEEPCILLYDSDIDYVLEDFEEVQEKAIKPVKNKIIL